MKLTEPQLEQFDREGYLFFPDLFSPEEAAFLKGEAEAIYQMDRKEVWRETSGVARTAFAAHTYNEGFRRLGSHPFFEPCVGIYLSFSPSGPGGLRTPVSSTPSHHGPSVG